MAAPLAAAAATEAWRALGALRERHPAARWLPPDKLHLTLVFLGQTPAERVAHVADAMTTVARSRAPLTVATGDGGGIVRDQRGGVAWLRLAAGSDDVAELALELDRAIGSRTYDARRQPRPHLTVARAVDQPLLDDLAVISRGLHLEWAVDRLALLRSQTDPAGSRYEELATCRLGDAAR